MVEGYKRSPSGISVGTGKFGIYVNDIVEGIDSHINLFADDAKLIRRVECEDDCKKLQEDLKRIVQWSRTWKMEFILNNARS